MLTGKSATAATEALEWLFEDSPSSISSEQAREALQPLLDPAADWPISTAVQFAAMAAGCLQPHKRRPDLQKHLQPALEKMLEEAAAAPTAPPMPAPAQPSRLAGQQLVVAAQQAQPAVFDPESSLMVSIECPICHDTLADPVSTPGGITFCRPCIIDWLSSHSTCPSSRQPLAVQQLVPNYALAGLLDEMSKLQLQQQQQQQQQNISPVPSAEADAQLAESGSAPPVPAPPVPAAATPVQPDPRWRELLRAAKAQPSNEVAWRAFARCFQGCTEISLKNLRVGDAGIAALAQQAARHWPNLQSLDLSWSSLGVDGVTALAQHAAQHWPNLQSLDLTWNCLRVEGVTALAQHAAQHWPNLQSLYLSSNSLDVEGVTALAQHAAQHWPNLQSLNLRSNSLGAEGVTALAQHAAQHWPNLQSLYLSGNNISDTALGQLVERHCPTSRWLLK
jgi:hypothetical protein